METAGAWAFICGVVSGVAVMLSMEVRRETLVITSLGMDEYVHYLGAIRHPEQDSRDVVERMLTRYSRRHWVLLGAGLFSVAALLALVLLGFQLAVGGQGLWTLWTAIAVLVSVASLWALLAADLQRAAALASTFDVSK